MKKMIKRNRGIDVIKGICIILILITHSELSSEIRLKLLFPFWVDMVVPLFLIISGYFYAKSYEKCGFSSIEQAYSLDYLLDKFIRFTVPFAIAYLVELYLKCFVFHEPMDLSGCVVGFICGGFGPGSYYYAIMMQFVLLYPVIYFVVKKYRFYGLVLCGFGNMLYELLQRSYGMSDSCYRLLIFRYILVIAFGCYLTTESKVLNRKLAICSLILGGGFILANSYLGYTPVILVRWTGTSFLACLYILPIAYVLIKKCNLKCAFFEVFGKASYNILLVQVVYYAYGIQFVRDYISNDGLQILVNILICSVLGIIFMYIEKPLTKFAKKIVQLPKKYFQKFSQKIIEMD